MQVTASCWAFWLQASPQIASIRRDPARHTDDEGVLKERDRPLADSAEESPYIHPASKIRFGSQHKGIISGRQQLEHGGLHCAAHRESCRVTAKA